jgi:hypothetical protein
MKTKADHIRTSSVGHPIFGTGNSASNLIFENRESIRGRSVRNTKAPKPKSDIRHNPGYSGSY